MNIELIQMQQTPNQDGTHLNIDLLFQMESRCYWRHIEMDGSPTFLEGGQEVALWKELLFVLHKQLCDVEEEHTGSKATYTVHPDLISVVNTLEKMVSA